MSQKLGFWSASGVFLSFAAGVNLGLWLKAEKKGRLTPKLARGDSAATVDGASSTDGNSPGKAISPKDCLPLRDLPPTTPHACAQTTEISRSATVSAEVMEPTAPVAQITHVTTSATTLLPPSVVVDEIGKPDKKLREKLFPTFTAIWHRIGQVRPRQSKKRLRVCESVSLGEKRFVAVIQVDGKQFLVGGSSNSISTLAHLDRPREFSEVLGSRYQQDFSQA